MKNLISDGIIYTLNKVFREKNQSIRFKWPSANSTPNSLVSEAYLKGETSDSKKFEC